MNWPATLFSGLRKLDKQEAPHGLYGLRKKHSWPNRLIPLYQLYGGKIPEADLGKQCGWEVHWKTTDRIIFRLESDEYLDLHLHTQASTKVRCFGDTFRLDKQHDKEPIDLAKRVLKLAPKLHTESNLYRPYQGLLIIAHAPGERDFEKHYQNPLNPDFLNRYHLSHHRTVWKDMHGRNFFTGLFLWAHEQSC
ncbi:hypothetical protein [Ruficoccus sp. ZRK36]|uniref:hypothetical protein n=1 Tax=Ruficoccus sp. ZRK36 TaxID=2866311 RepID=UPI001C737AD9|nr:hypothetical protein [Ruficoccus sp. ZRK36]QYY36441.1 hypothetical protein K0V07_02975 [Ruficoccus sp. ZRK36]